MKKYNKSEIMKAAWNLYRMAQKWVGEKLSFAECLKRAWAKAKKIVSYMTGKHTVNMGTMFHQLNIVVDMDNLTVSGNTFNCKETLKRDYACKWDAENKVWKSDKENLFNLVANN